MGETFAVISSWLWVCDEAVSDDMVCAVRRWDMAGGGYQSSIKVLTGAMMEKMITGAN